MSTKTYKVRFAICYFESDPSAEAFAKDDEFTLDLSEWQEHDTDGKATLSFVNILMIGEQVLVRENQSVAYLWMDGYEDEEGFHELSDSKEYGRGYEEFPPKRSGSKIAAKVQKIIDSVQYKSNPVSQKEEAPVTTNPSNLPERGKDQSFAGFDMDTPEGVRVHFSIPQTGEGTIDEFGQAVLEIVTRFTALGFKKSEFAQRGGGFGGSKGGFGGSNGAKKPDNRPAEWIQMQTLTAKSDGREFKKLAFFAANGDKAADKPIISEIARLVAPMLIETGFNENELFELVSDGRVHKLPFPLKIEIGKNDGGYDTIKGVKRTTSEFEEEKSNNPKW